MTAIILAGGLGTRLKSIISDVPKCMAKISNKPFLSYLLDKLHSSGFIRVVIAVGFLRNVIIDFYGPKYKTLEIVYSIEEEPLGTGGAIINASKFLSDEYFFVINGDTFFDINYIDMYKNRKDFLIASCYIQNPLRFGTILYKKDLILQFVEKGTLNSGYINGGIYLIRTSFLKKFKFNFKFSFEKDFLEKYVSYGFFSIYKSDGLFIDIGIPSDYIIAQKYLINE